MIKVKEPPALYASPGPGGYVLPTGVGRNGHDPTRKIAPSFSFGSRYNKFVDQSPGPIYQVDPEVTNKGKGGLPRYSIRSRWTPKKILFVSPGPNVYFLDDDGGAKYKRSPKYSIGTRLGIDNHTAGPGPAYMATYKYTARAATITGRMDRYNYAHDYAKTPGPASSLGSDVVLKRPPAFSMQGRTKLPENKMITPGPGAYDVKPIGTSCPRCTFVNRYHKNYRPFYTLPDVSD